MNRKAHVAYNVNCTVETEGLLKVMGSHIQCKSYSISEIVQDNDTITTWVSLKKNISHNYLNKFIVHNFQMTFLCLHKSSEMPGVITVILPAKYTNCNSANCNKLHCESKKLGHFYFYCNFGKCWSIF